MQNLRIALALRLLRPELRDLDYDAHKAFAYVADHNTRKGGYVQGVSSGIERVRRLRRAATPAETVDRFTRHFKAPSSTG